MNTLKKRISLAALAFLFVFAITANSQTEEYKGNTGTTNKKETSAIPETLKSTKGVPVAVNDTYYTSVNGTLTVNAPGVLANDVDDDLDPLTAHLVSNVSQGTLNFNPDGSFVYTPPVGFYGPVTFSYLVTDGTQTNGSALDFNGGTMNSPWVDATGNNGNKQSAAALGLPTNNITIETWVYPRSFEYWRAMVSFIQDNGSTEYGWVLQLGDGGTFNFGLAAGGSGLTYLGSGSTFPVNTWHHVAGVYDGTQMRIYVNGQLQGTSNVQSGNIAYLNSWLAIGALKDDDWHKSIDGTVDEVRIWNVARTQAQIQDDMNRRLNPGEPGLVSYWQKDEGSGGTTADIGPGNHTGVLSGTPVLPLWVTGKSLPTTSNIATVTIYVHDILTWNGSISSDWNTSGNWSSAIVPTADYDVMIPSGSLPNLPSVAGTPGSPSACHDLTIDNALTIGAGNALTVTGALNNNIGNAGILIVSGPAGTGSLITSTTSVSATVETYILSNRWHFVSSPVSDAVSGIFTGFYLQNHDETTNLYSDIISVASPLNVMQGYALWAGTSNIFNYSGNLNSGALSFGLTRNNLGWNLTGNPYPSSIDWDASSGWTKTNVNNAIYVENNGSWATYIAGVGTNGGTRYIAPGQGFFVNCNTHPGTLGMTDAVRVHNATAFFKNEVSEMVRLSVANNSYTDEMVVRFMNGATEAFDGNYDAYKLASLDAIPELFSFGGTDELAINALPETQLVQLGFRCQEGGSYTISAPEIKDITNVVLEDKLSGTFIDLNVTSHTFNYQAGDDANRFVLHFTPLSIEQQNENPFGVYASGKNIYLNSDQNAQVTVFDLLGKQVKSVAVGSGSSRIEVAKSGIYLVRVQSAGQAFTTKVNIQ